MWAQDWMSELAREWMPPVHACVHISLWIQMGQAVYCTTALWLPMVTSECQGHSSWEVRALRPWLQVGSGPGRLVSTPSHLGAGGMIHVCACFCVQIHLPSFLHQSPATSSVESTAKSAERNWQGPSPCKIVGSLRKICNWDEGVF